jgi:hypothetical protein
MREWRSVSTRRWLWAVGAIAVALAGTVIFIASTTPSSSHVSFAGQASVSSADYVGVCPVGAPIPLRYYDLGPRFAGLKRTSHKEVCNPPPLAGIRVRSGSSGAVGYVSVTYGTCAPSSAAGCFPPLEVQSWPECARNPNTFREGGTGRETQQNALNPSNAVRFQAATRIPAQAFEGGARLEIYSGDTTIVVFAGDRDQASRAAAELAAVAADRVGSASARGLRAAARQPGDASACQHRLFPVDPSQIPQEEQ